jgi:hypothetical protein
MSYLLRKIKNSKKIRLAILLPIFTLASIFSLNKFQTESHKDNYETYSKLASFLPFNCQEKYKLEGYAYEELSLTESKLNYLPFHYSYTQIKNPLPDWRRCTPLEGTDRKNRGYSYESIQMCKK